MIYVICGPTGSGKTKASLELASFFHAPIINADAFQIYQNMDIGTAKIAKNHPLYEKHYLLDIVTPENTFSVKQYQDIFRKTIDELRNEYNDCGRWWKGLSLRHLFSILILRITQMKKMTIWIRRPTKNFGTFLRNLTISHLTSLHKNNRKRVIRATGLQSITLLTRAITSKCSLMK